MSESNLHEEIVALFAASGFRQTMGLQIIDSDEGHAVVLCKVTDRFANTRGVAHGGLISGLIDSAAGIAVKLAQREPKLPLATVSLTVNYLRPAPVGRTLKAVGHHVSGRGTPSVRVEVHDDQGEHVAMGLVTLRVSRERDGD